MTEYTTFSGSAGPAPRGAGATHDPEHAPARSSELAGRSERSRPDRFHKSVWVLGTRPTVSQRPSDATEPPDHLRRRAPLVARCPVDGPARPRRGPAAEKSRTRTRSPYTPPRRSNERVYNVPRPEGSLRKPHGNTLLYCTDIGNCDFAVALYCRVSTTFYDYVSLSTCVKSSSEDRSGSAPLDVVYVRSASHGSTEGRSSPWPPIPKGTYASFSSSPSS